jgi:phenylpropionate dioxygenase-like ring-hydroxylating dioxygenase large terminal subunit
MDLHRCASSRTRSDPAAEGVVASTQWFVRDLPLRFDSLCENVADPSHVPFAHHKVQVREKSVIHKIFCACLAVLMYETFYHALMAV